MSKKKTDIIIPVAMPKGELDHNYERFIKDIEQNIKKERLNIVKAANRKMILLYWMIGDKILVSLLSMSNHLQYGRNIY